MHLLHNRSPKNKEVCKIDRNLPDSRMGTKGIDLTIIT